MGIITKEKRFKKGHRSKIFIPQIRRFFVLRRSGKEFGVILKKFTYNYFQRKSWLEF
jgi:hypothetical protein